MGAFRYWTDIRCVRHWRWFSHPGPAEIVRTVLPACGRAVAVVGALMVPPAAAVVAAPYAVPAQPLPWIGQPDLFGAGVGAVGAYALGGPSYGYGEEYAGRSGPSVEGPELTAALVPGGLPVVGTAYTIPELASGRPLPGSGLLRVEADRDRYLGGPDTRSGVPTPEGPPRAEGGSPSPQPVPEPAALALVLAGLLGLAVWRRAA